MCKVADTGNLACFLSLPLQMSLSHSLSLFWGQSESVPKMEVDLK